MSKTKKRKKQQKRASDDFLIVVDQSLDRKYLDLLEEVQFMQADLKRAERKNKKKQKKKLSKGGYFYDRDDIRARQQIIYQMEGTNFFDRASNLIEDMKPICKIIAKLIMSLIVAILSIDAIKYTIRPETLKKLQTMYGIARTVSGGY